MNTEKLISGAHLIENMENELKSLKELDWWTDVQYNAYADAIRDMKIYIERLQAQTTPQP